MDYVVAAKFTQPIQRLIAARNNWILLDTGIEICEQMYQSDSWKTKTIGHCKAKNKRQT